MSLWVDRAVAGPRTRALIIGVSEYEHLPQAGGPDPDDVTVLMGLGQIDCGASAAFEIASWLNSSYYNPDAPLGTIQLLLSPSTVELSDPALAAVATTVDRARKAEVQSAINAWWTACNSNPADVALLYVAGHGIGLNKDDGAVLLLEDFDGKLPKPLDAALDTGELRRGMNGPGMPHDQLYFVDVCRVRPEIASEYSSLRAGVAIDVPADGWSSAPMYYSAAASKQAYGLPGRGTFFSQALIECLDLLSVERDDTLDEWRVTQGSLATMLSRRVAEIGTGVGYPQEVVVGGSMTAGAIIHQAPQRPRLEIDVQVDPIAASSCAKATIVSEPDAPVAVDHPVPTRLSVPAGLYTVKIRIEPPTPEYADNARACIAEPPRTRPNPVVVPV